MKVMIKPRNFIAKELRSGRFTSKVVQSKKVYNRKRVSKKLHD